MTVQSKIYHVYGQNILAFYMFFSFSPARCMDRSRPEGLPSSWQLSLLSSVEFWRYVLSSADADCHVGPTWHREGTLFFYECLEYSCFSGKKLLTGVQDPSCCKREDFLIRSGDRFTLRCKEYSCEAGAVSIVKERSSECCDFQGHVLAHEEEFPMTCGMFRCYGGTIMGTDGSHASCGTCHIHPGLNMITFSGINMAFQSQCSYSLLKVYNEEVITIKFGKCHASTYSDTMSCVENLTVYESGDPILVIATGTANDTIIVGGTERKVGPVVEHFGKTTMAWAVPSGIRVLTSFNAMIESRNGVVSLWLPLELQRRVSGLCGQYSSTRPVVSPLVRETPPLYYSYVTSSNDSEASMERYASQISQWKNATCQDHLLTEKNVCFRSFLFGSNRIGMCTEIIDRVVNGRNVPGVSAFYHYWVGEF